MVDAGIESNQPFATGRDHACLLQNLQASFLLDHRPQKSPFSRAFLAGNSSVL